MLLEFRNEIKEIFEDIDVENPSLEKPPKEINAEIASTVSFSFENPPKKAQELVSKIKNKNFRLIGEVSAKGPYINFNVSDLYLKETLEKSQKSSYPILPEKNEKILLEHTSANPTGPLHVGRARNPIIGDSIGRILKAAGYDVEIEYYVNDMGRQVASLALEFRENEIGEGKPDHEIARLYRKARDNGVEEFLQKLDQGDEESLSLVEKVVETCLDGQLQTLERLEVSFDSFIHESEFVLNGDVDNVVENLKRSDKCYRENSALKLKTNTEEDLTFLRSDGTTLYTTRDIAYHIDKIKRCDRIINILGEDHELQTKQLLSALKLLEEEPNITNVFYSYVTLPEGSMSTREGKAVNVDELLDEAVKRAKKEVKSRTRDRNRKIDNRKKWEEKVSETVGVGSVRFDIISRKPRKPIEFKWEDALDFEGGSPYIQYTHARASGILEKAEIEPSELDIDIETLKETLTSSEEINLLKKIGELSIIIEDSAQELSPHLITVYSRKLAETFNEFYRDNPVLDTEKKLKKYRLALTKSSKNTLAKSLNLVGVKAPDVM